MVRIILVDLIDESKEHRIHIGKTSLGRTAENNIQIKNDAISKKHCEVYREENNRLSVRDIGSKNGTYINNLKIPENKRYLLKNDYILRLCSYEFRIKIEEGEDLEETEEELLRDLELDDSDTAHDFREEIDKA